MFRRGDGKPWNKSQQKVPMQETCARAKITPRISFHGLRHTWASLATMKGVPLMVVAKNLGHVDTRMVEKHTGIWRRASLSTPSARARLALTRPKPESASRRAWTPPDQRSCVKLPAKPRGEIQIAH
jgi:integrase